MILKDVIELVNNSPDSTWIVGVVTSIATMIGTMLTIYFTNKATRTQIKAEVENYQKTQLIDLNKEILEDAVMMLRLNDLSQKEQDKLIRRIIIGVMAHGSKETISLLAHFQQLNYSKDKTDDDTYKTMAYPALLISQIKFETTGVIIDPTDILKINLNDYATNKVFQEKISYQINLLISELGLNDKFIVSSI